MSKLGTEWVAPGEGSTLEELRRAFLAAKVWYGAGRFIPKTTGNERTNLRLTGEPISEYDWQRLESAAFQVGE